MESKYTNQIVRSNNLQLDDKKILTYSLIIAIIILGIFPLIRVAFYDATFIGEESYYNYRLADHILENGIPEQDPLIERPYLLNPYHLILAGIAIALFGKLALVSFILPFVLGVLSVFLSYHLLKNLKLNFMRKFIIML